MLSRVGERFGERMKDIRRNSCTADLDRSCALANVGTKAIQIGDDFGRCALALAKNLVDADDVRGLEQFRKNS